MDGYMDGMLWRVMWKIVDCVELTFLWIAFSLPVFTVGASTTALYACALNVAAGREGTLHRDYWQAFRRYFRRATAAWLVAAALIALGLADAYLCLKWDSVLARGILGALMVIAVALTMILLYLPALMTRREESLPRLAVMAFYLAARYFPVTIGMLGAWVAVVMAALGISNVFWALSAGLGALLCAYMLLPVFRARGLEADD